MTKRVSNSRRSLHRGLMARQMARISLVQKSILNNATKEAMSSHGNQFMRDAVRSMFEGTKKPSRSNLSRRGS